MNNREEKTFKFPQCWEDDVRMNSLFAPFRTRNINPTDWDSKMKFWDSLIEQWCVYYKMPVIEVPVLNSSFERKGKVPSCLPEVVENLSRRKTLITKDVFYQMTEPSWKSWAVQVLVTNPLKWTLNKVKTTITGKTDNSNTTLIHLPAIQRISMDIDQNMPEIYRGKLIDIDLFQHITGITHMEVLLLIIHWLQSQKLIALQQNQSKLLIKFTKKHSSAPTITDIDKALFSLEQSKIKLEKKVESLEKEKEHLLTEAGRLVSEKKLLSAKTTLRRKKTVENVIKKLSDAVENIVQLIYQMEMAEMDCEILRCYETGVSTLNKFFKENGLTKESILNTKNELEEALILKNDIDDILSDSFYSSATSVSNEELEEELNSLLNTDDKQTLDDKLLILKELPDVPSQEPKISVDTLGEKIADLAL